MVLKASNLFIMYSLFDIFNRGMLNGDYSINYVLLVIAVVASFIGSTVQATHLSLKVKLKLNRLIAIYSSGIFVAYFSYELGMYYQSAPLTGMTSAILSYFSVEFLEAFKNMVIGTINGLKRVLPKVIGDILKYRYGGGSNNNNEIEDEIDKEL